jgi:putative two-component system response regulator
LGVFACPFLQSWRNKLGNFAAFSRDTVKNNFIKQPLPFHASESEPAHILIVDDDALVREALANKLENLGYQCECCESGPEAIDLLSCKNFDLVLADALLPAIVGTPFLKEAMNVCPDVAVILATSVIDIEVAIESLKDGAYDWITKPFNLEEVSISVSRALGKRRLLIENRHYQHALEEQVASRTSQLKEALRVLEHTYHDTLVALSRALESREADSDGRSLRITVCAKRLGRQIGLSQSQIRAMEQGALLHDIGKIGIPDELLKKSDSLNEEQQRVMRRHPEIGCHILSNIRFLAKAARLVLHHHERYDGKGYPQGLQGEEIELEARIFSVVEAMEDIISDDQLQSCVGFEGVIQEMTNLSGTQLDPNLVKEFLKIPFAEWVEIRKEVAANTNRTDFLQKAMQF